MTIAKIVHLKTFVILAFVAFYSIESFSQGGNLKVFNSTGSGSWTNVDYWDARSYPDTNDLNRAIININKENSIILDGNLSAKNSVYVNIYNNASLRIIENLTVKNHFEITIHEGGSFFVGGDVHIYAGQGGPVTGQLIINGDAEIEGDLTGNGNVSGNGYLYVGGLIGDGISFDDSNVAVVCGTKAPPQDINADVYFNSIYYSVNLAWSFNNSTPNSTGVSEFIVTRNDIVIGSVAYGSRSDSYSYLDSGLEAGDTPIYKVYALYNDNIRSQPAIKSFENAPLPIELLHFNVTSEKDHVLIDWATAAEINNDFFTIERSIDGYTWSVLGYVEGAGNSNHTRYYGFKDENPVNGVSYYRLKQTDYDGQYEYFEPVAVQFRSDNNELKIVSVRNSRNNLTIVFNCNDHNALLEAIDINGRVIHRQNVNNSLHLQETNINLSHNYPGKVLFIRLYSQHGSDQRKVMVY